jgi:hypothetical protein
LISQGENSIKEYKKLMELKVKFLSKKIGKEIPAPFYATEGSAGMDLAACIDKPCIESGGKGCGSDRDCNCPAFKQVCGFGICTKFPWFKKRHYIAQRRRRYRQRLSR